MKSPGLSVVIPAYNEKARIVPTLEKIAEFMKRKGWEAEILVVDDGSGDGTARVVEELSASIPSLRLLRNERNEGKGSSVRKGVLSARGEMIFFTDADLSTPIEELEHFLREIEGADIVIGSRSIEGADVVVHEPIYRELLGKVFNRCVRLLCVPGFIDTQCGAKLFRRQAALAIFPKVRISRFAFDVEVLYLARALGYRAKEVPVRWTYSFNTRVRTFQDGPKMLWDVLRIRWLHRNAAGEGARE